MDTRISELIGRITALEAEAPVEATPDTEAGASP